MAAASSVPSTPIQELIKSDTNLIPERYVVTNPNPDTKSESNGCVLPWMDSIIIDLQLLLDFSSPCAQKELLKLRDALSSWGCFQLVNHGIASSVMEQLHYVGKEFFALPLEEKQKYSRTVEWIEGYGCDIVSEDQPINWNDRLHLRIHPPEQRNLKLWPEIVPNFRETLHEYSVGMRKVLEIMLSAIAKSLNLEQNTFVSQLGEDSTFFARFNFYPPCPHPDRVIGLKPHSDATLITILLQDKDVEGLQVLKDDQWYKVPVIPNALFINVGDLLELVNHGVASSLMDQLHSVGKEFFALPLEKKLKYSRTAEWFEGYGSDVVSEDQPINWNDRLHLRIHPPEQRNLKLWPDIVPKFSETLDEYASELRKVLEIMLRAIAKSLNLEENTFLSQLGEDGTFFARFNFYPPCPHPDRVLGLRPHSDGTLITMLLQDQDVEGLQVLKDDQWYKVPIIPHALFINVGDQLEILSNGILKSSVHRAMIDKVKERMSVAVPSSVAIDKEIGPLSELITADRPRLYKNVDNYIPTFLQHYARGESAINAMKIQQ